MGGPFNVIKDAISQGCKVIIVGAVGQARSRLEKLQVLDLLPSSNLCARRIVALELSLNLLDDQSPDPLPMEIA